MMSDEPEANRLAWLCKHTPNFETAFLEVQEVKRQEALNKEKFNVANLARGADVRT
jgi:hypothetical protein